LPGLLWKEPGIFLKFLIFVSTLPLCHRRNQNFYVVRNIDFYVLWNVDFYVCQSGSPICWRLCLQKSVLGAPNFRHLSSTTATTAAKKRQKMEFPFFCCSTLDAWQQECQMDYFKTKVPILVKLGGPRNGKCCYILRPFGIFYGHLV
jgi:hypothetical protein